MHENELLFALLRAEVCGTPVDKQIIQTLSPQLMQKLYTLADRHDLAHIASQALGKLGLLKEDAISQKFKDKAMQAMYRYVQMEHGYGQACKVLEEASIPFIPLKGAVLRAHYPQPWMRTSCDIDILVKEETLDAAASLLTQKLGYRNRGKSDHDVLLSSESGVHLELHYDTIQERYAVNGCRDVLAEVWQDARRKEAGSHHYCMSDAMFYFYHIAHMAKHFEVGGCGVRSFLDLWIMNHRMEFDGAAREALLHDGGLLKFAQAAEKLSEAWFSGEKMDAMTGQVSDYILRAGLYGDEENRAALGQARMGGRLRYVLLRRVFMPYDYLKAEYPVLEKHKWLTPVYQVVRWLRVLRGKDVRRRVAELKTTAAVSESQTASAAALLKYLDL